MASGPQGELARDRADDMAVRAAGQRLPVEAARGRRAVRPGERAPPGGERRDGSPSYAPDVAEAIVAAAGEDGPFSLGRIEHIVNGGVASRADWARELLRQSGIAIPIEEVPVATWPRASTPPLWGVLAPTRPLRSWQAALADYVPIILRQRAAP